MKKLTLSEFKDFVNKNDSNRLKGEGIADIFRENNRSFTIVCKKCGSMNVEIIGEDGNDFGESTGYSEGENILKCNNCGNAVTVWK